MDPDFAYLLGAAGDASVIYNPKKNEYYIEYWQKVPEWLEESVKRRIEKIYEKRLKVRSKTGGLFMLRFYSKEAYYRFKEFEGNPFQILDEPIDAQLQYLRGFFDAEGSAPKRKPGTSYRLHIYQKDRKCLRILSQILQNLGIFAGSITSSRDVGLLPIRGRENLAKFAQVVKPEHPGKRTALQQTLSVY